MLKRVTETDFVDMVKRSQYKDNFTERGLLTLFEHLDSEDRHTCSYGGGEERIIDLGEITMDYNQWKNPVEACKELGLTVECTAGPEEDEDTREVRYTEDCMRELEDWFSKVLEVPNGEGIIVNIRS